MSVDLAAAIREAIVNNSDITADLPAYVGSYPVFTRRPVPSQAPYPLIAISPDVSSADTLRLLAVETPQIVRDIIIAGNQETAEVYRTVERIAYNVQALFHRNKRAIDIEGYTVDFINAFGPIIGPTDDDAKVVRIVTLTISLTSTA